MIYMALSFFFSEENMRYHYKKPAIYASMYGQLYICDHPVYSRCTLFKINDKGLAVIQQRHNSDEKTTYWSEMDPWIADDIYLNIGFKTFLISVRENV